jgi:hypothetical protein
VVPLLKSVPGQRAAPIFDKIRRRHPEIGAGARRTLERRICTWRALDGVARRHLGVRASTGSTWFVRFTDLGDHGVSIAAAPPDHRLYPLPIGFLGLEDAHVVHATSASWHWPRACRMRCGRSAAFPCSITGTACQPPSAVSTTTRGTIRRAVSALCAHYGMEPTRNNRGPGTRERLDRKPARSPQAAIKDALLLRGSRDFDTVDAIVASSTRLSRGATRATPSDLISSARLQSLPARRTMDYEETSSPSLRPAGSPSEKCSIQCLAPNRTIGFTCGSTTTGSNAFLDWTR